MHSIEYPFCDECVIYYSRPSSDDVLGHCLFWNKQKTLNFFLDVSDRLEKEGASSPILQCVESQAKLVVGRDWRNKITNDLRIGALLTS